MRKRLISILLAVVMCITLFGCAAVPPTAPAEEPAKAADTRSPEAQPEKAAEAPAPVASASRKFGVLYCLLSAPAVKVMAGGVQEAAQRLGVELVELDAGWDAQKQTDQMNSLISQGVDAIILNPVDNKSLIPAAKKAQEAGIPVVTAAMNLDEAGQEYINAFVGADEIDVGRAAGEMMLKALGDAGGKVVIVEGQAGTDPQINRTKGFEEVVAKNANISVVAKLPGDFDKAKAMAVTEDALTKYPDIAGIWVHDDTMCVGVVQAMKAMSFTGEQIKVVSYNGSKAGADMVKSGEIIGTAVQPLAWEGATAVQIALDVLDGKPVDKWYKDVIEPITPENVSSYDPALLW